MPDTPPKLTVYTDHSLTYIEAQLVLILSHLLPISRLYLFSHIAD